LNFLIQREFVNFDKFIEIFAKKRLFIRKSQESLIPFTKLHARERYPNMGIVMLTARVRSIDRHEGYDSGADVYLTKPVNPSELTTVLQNLCRRISPQAGNPSWSLHLASLQLVSPAKEAIKLTVSEAKLLQELALSGELLSMSRLIEVFGDIDLPEPTNKLRIEQVVSRVRRKMDVLLGGQPSIKAVTRLGYKLFVPVVIE
jgi:DNA-binding response OmpR family regulator